MKQSTFQNDDHSPTLFQKSRDDAVPTIQTSNLGHPNQTLALDEIKVNHALEQLSSFILTPQTRFPIG